VLCSVTAGAFVAGGVPSCSLFPVSLRLAPFRALRFVPCFAISSVGRVLLAGRRFAARRWLVPRPLLFSFFAWVFPGRVNPARCCGFNFLSGLVQPSYL